MNSIHIAVDAMGGDHGPSVTIPAAIEAIKQYPDLKISLFGSQQSISPFLADLDQFSNQIQCIDCPTQIDMDDKPSSVLRSKQDSSLYRTIESVSLQQAQACVSAGNTGAMMAIGCYLLKTFTGISRPAVCAEIPTSKGATLMLDLGANVDTSADNLNEFATMGSLMSSRVLGCKNPSVMLLNIGKELGKGNSLVREADELLKQNKLINYQGFIEGDDIYQGAADVVVCDGFVGNVVLKASEGLARFIMGKIASATAANDAADNSKQFADELNPSGYNGATFLGLHGVAVASHGNADKLGFVSAIKLAYRQVEQNLPAYIDGQLIKS